MKGGSASFMVIPRNAQRTSHSSSLMYLPLRNKTKSCFTCQHSLLSPILHYHTSIATPKIGTKKVNTLFLKNSVLKPNFTFHLRKSVHQVASHSFNYNAELYNKSRPSYPPEALEFVMKKLKEIRFQQSQSQDQNENKAPCRVLDLAAGSGLFTKCMLPFIKRKENEEKDKSPSLLPLIDELYAVEPVKGMRNEFQASLPNYVPIVEGNSHKIPFPDNYFDMVTVAQAFHWFASRSSLMEINRVLKKTPDNISANGGLILIWNLESRKSLLTSKLRDIYERYDSDVPQYRKGEWENAFEAADQKEKQQNLFEPLERKEFVHYMLVSQEEIWDRIVSKSYITALKTNKQEEEFLKCENDVKKVIQEEQREFCHKRSSDEIGLDGIICYRQPIDCEVVFTKCLS